MINLGILDVIIAMIVVLVVLSLIVQSIQSLIKKLFKMKSAVVLNSLVDLFEYVKSHELCGKRPQEVVDLVKAEFKKLGRETVRGKLMLDSISKADLMKILNRIVETNPEIKTVAADKLQAFQTQAEAWFDTVMQGFDERYTRNMKTVGLVIAAVVTIVLNANFFTVFQKIYQDSNTRSAIIKAAPDIQKQVSTTASPAASPSPDTGNQTAGIKEDANEAKNNASTFASFGFGPLKPQQISDFFNASGPYAGKTRQWRLEHLLTVLVGWAIMTLLLSVGAPFWEDVLESLFGVKNLLRKKTDTRNVEDTTGGQQKP